MKPTNESKNEYESLNTLAYLFRSLLCDDKCCIIYLLCSARTKYDRTHFAKRFLRRTITFLHSVRTSIPSSLTSLLYNIPFALSHTFIYALILTTLAVKPFHNIFHINSVCIPRNHLMNSTRNILVCVLYEFEGTSYFRSGQFMAPLRRYERFSSLCNYTGASSILTKLRWSPRWALVCRRIKIKCTQTSPMGPMESLRFIGNKISVLFSGQRHRVARIFLLLHSQRRLKMNGEH